MNISTIHNTWFPPTLQQRFTTRSLEPNLSWQQPLDSFHGSSKVNDHSDLEAFAWAPQYKNGNARKKTRVCNTINVCVLLTLQDQRRPSAKTYTFIYIYGYNSLALAKHLYLLDSWCVCGLSKSHALLTAIVWPNCKGKHTYNQILIDAFIVGRQCTNSRDNLSSGKQEQQQVYVKQTLKITLRKQSQCS